VCAGVWKWEGGGGRGGEFSVPVGEKGKADEIV